MRFLDIYSLVVSLKDELTEYRVCLVFSRCDRYAYLKYPTLLF